VGVRNTTANDDDEFQTSTKPGLRRRWLECLGERWAATPPPQALVSTVLLAMRGAMVPKMPQNRCACQRNVRCSALTDHCSPGPAVMPGRLLDNKKPRAALRCVCCRRPLSTPLALLLLPSRRLPGDASTRPPVVVRRRRDPESTLLNSAACCPSGRCCTSVRRPANYRPALCSRPCTAPPLPFSTLSLQSRTPSPQAVLKRYRSCRPPPPPWYFPLWTVAAAAPVACSSKVEYLPGTCRRDS
jgi:hypothetical protein